MSIFEPHPKAAALIVKKSCGYAAHNILESTCILYKKIEPLLFELYQILKSWVLMGPTQKLVYLLAKNGMDMLS